MALSKCGSFTAGKGWRRSIGFKLLDGRLIPARWWLGSDQTKATASALAIESLWVGLDAPYWTVEAMAEAEAIRVGGLTKESSPATATPKVKQAIVLTFGGLIDRFRTAYTADARRSMPSKHSMISRLKTLERSPLANTPLAEIGAEQLASLVSYWLARPNNSYDKPISEFSARMVVKTARAVMDWADAIGVWIAPRRFDRLFRLPKISSAPKIKTYSVEELRRLYRHADDRMKCFLLLGIQCGFCSMELASLKRSEIYLAEKIIKRPRQKTGIEQSWHLWDETIALLKKNLASEGELAFVRDNGEPLVTFNADHRRLDFFPNAWAALLRRANKDKKAAAIVGSFKTLPKTGATMIRAIAGIEVSEMYLAHSEKSMARFYSTPAGSALTAALIELRKQLDLSRKSKAIPKPKTQAQRKAA